MANRIVKSVYLGGDGRLRAVSEGLAPTSGAIVERPDPTTFDLQWLANWIRKLEDERGIKTGELAEICQTQSPRISQLKVEGNDTPPGVELFWRLMAVLHDVQEWAALPDREIRAILFRALASIGPSRMHYLASISTSEAQSMIDDHEHKAASRQRLLAIKPPADDSPEKDKPS